MTGLAGFASHPLHQRARLGHQSLQRVMVVHQLKELQRKLIAFFGSRSGYVAPLLQTNQHPEDLGDGAAKAAGNLAMGQRLRDRGK